MEGFSSIAEDWISDDRGAHSHVGLTAIWHSDLSHIAYTLAIKHGANDIIGRYILLDEPCSDASVLHGF